MQAQGHCQWYLLQVAYALDPFGDALAVLGWILYFGHYSSGF